MDSASTSALNRIWADATPLAKFIEDRALQLFRQTPAAPWLAVDAPGESSGLGMRIAAGLESYKDLLAARDRAKTDTINDLVAGRLVGLGRAPGSPNLEKIEALFWVGAEPDSRNSVKSARRKMTHVRIAPTEAIRAVQPNAQDGPGRPTEAELIRAAIADYAKKDPALKRPPSIRHRAYRSYISSQGVDPHGPGFSGKTFQKYESEYRNGFK